MSTQGCVLSKGWAWKQRDDSIKLVVDELRAPTQVFVKSTADITKQWTEAQTSPSEIHVELLKNGVIPDPYVGFNEHRVQWIGEVEWLYRTSFTLDQNTLTTSHHVLQFDGLDTICDVFLNGKRILSALNAFRTFTYTIPRKVVKQDNTLLLHFKSAKHYAKIEEEKYGKVRAGSTNLGDPSRVYVRKPQYGWRWDWGPELMTCGPYRPITLTSFRTRIKDYYPKAHLDFTPSKTTPSLGLDLILEGSYAESELTLDVTLKDKQSNTIRSESSSLSLDKDGVGKDVIHWDPVDVEPWWPVGYGEQNLYDVEVTLKDSDGTVLDTRTKRVGFRDVKLIQERLTEPDQYGTGKTFLFQVNNVRMFIGGSNWVPADCFLTTISDERYRKWLTLLRDGNQNMVRIWGGGIYEPDIFYDVCDEFGILVWLDFQFACGVYPAHPSFVANVRSEAIDNVTRLRHHPALALFCGNNEDYQMVLQWGDVESLPATKLYEDVLPGVVAELTDPEVPYHRGSPYGGKGWDTADPTVGDVHQWNFWGGKEMPYQLYDQHGGRFISEFGIPAYPSLTTVKHWMSTDLSDQWFAQSPIMAQHCRAGSFERRFAIVMNENFRVTEDFETYLFNTRMMQSEAVSFAYRSWKRGWKGPGKQYTAGVIVWQLNDCWPVTSWSIADYFLRPKPVYYSIKRELAPITVGIYRTVIKNRDNDRPKQFYEYSAFQSQGATLDIWATNSTLAPRSVRLQLSFFDLKTGWSTSQAHNAPRLEQNQVTEFVRVPCLGPELKGKYGGSPTGFGEWTTTSSVVVGARLVDDETEEVLARCVDFPQPYRYYTFPDPGLKVVLEAGMADGKDERIVRISVDKPVLGLFLSSEDEDPEVWWSDNCLSVVPGDEQVVVVRNLGERKVKVAHMGREKGYLLH